jgi:hypothetical protein
MDLKIYSNILAFLLFGFFNNQVANAQTNSTSQNLSKEQAVKYIQDKLKIADPVFKDFILGNNGELLIKWYNNGIYSEYRFNIREVDFDLKVNENGFNYIEISCISNVIVCLQNTTRQVLPQDGEKVFFTFHSTLKIENVGGFNNVASLNNALKYLKILSIQDNADSNSKTKDPFLYLSGINLL